jgi:hypothetical protein
VIHIHNGDVTAMLAKRSGLEGEHLPFRESLVAGPVPGSIMDHDWIETRARFLSDAYGENLLRVRNDLLEQERALDAAAAQDEVVLWFEHDLFCLMNFLYLLTRLARHPRVTAVWCDQPIGTREEGDLHPLFDSRRAVTPAMLAAAQRGWSAYAAADPTVLNGMIRGEDADFPFLRTGLELHAMRFPSARNGLGAVESRAMALITAGAADFGSLFDAFNTDVPRYGLGDGEFYRVLWRLANVAVPMLAMTKGEGLASPPKALFAVTPAGEKVMAGQADFLDLNGADFWLGGAHLMNGKVWRWDGRQLV